MIAPDDDLMVGSHMAAVDGQDDLVPLEQMVEEDPMLRAALEELARKEHTLLALQAQAEIEAINREVRTMNAMDGVGLVRRVMPAFAWHDIARQMGGVECFADKSFNRYLDRKAPETRIAATGVKPGNGLALQVGWKPPEPRYTKNYGP